MWCGHRGLAYLVAEPTRVETVERREDRAARAIARPREDRPRQLEERQGSRRARPRSQLDAGEERRPALAHHLAGDHEPLDLVRPLVDLGDLRVAHHPLDRVLLHVAVAAEDLHGVRRHGHRGVGAEELRHRRGLRQLGPVDARVDHPPDPVEEPARGLALRLHVGEHRGDELVLGDRPPERLARPRVVERVVGRTLRDPERLRGDAGPRAVEDAHRDPEPLALLADDGLGGHAAVGEEDLAGRRALDAHLRLDAADLEPGRVRLDEEARDPPVPGCRVGLREDRVQPCDARVRDEPLRAVEDVLVALAPGGRQASRPSPSRTRAPSARTRRATRRTRTAAGSAPSARPSRAGGSRGSTRSWHRENQPGRRADLRELLDRDEHHQRARLGAAVALLEREREDLCLPQRLDDVPGELARTHRSRPRGARPSRPRRAGRARGARAAPRRARRTPWRDCRPGPRARRAHPQRAKGRARPCRYRSAYVAGHSFRLLASVPRLRALVLAASAARRTDDRTRAATSTFPIPDGPARRSILDRPSTTRA